MNVFLVSTNDSAWLLLAGNAATATFRAINSGLLDGEGPLQVTAREYSEAAWMALVSATIAGRLRRLIVRPLSACGTHEGLLDVLVGAEGALTDAKLLLREATTAYDRASAADIVCVQTILENE